MVGTGTRLKTRSCEKSVPDESRSVCHHDAVNGLEERGREPGAVNAPSTCIEVAVATSLSHGSRAFISVIPSAQLQPEKFRLFCTAWQSEPPSGSVQSLTGPLVVSVELQAPRFVYL